MVKPPVTPAGEPLSAVWAQGEAARDPFIARARSFAAVTLPYLAPDVGSGGTGEDLPEPFQSVGGRGVSNLASRMTLTLFPPQIPFFKYELNPVRFAKALGAAENRELDLNQPGPDVDLFNKQATTMKLVLARREREIQRALDATGFRSAANEACLHLVVSGNYLLRYDREGSATGFRLDQFQVERDGDGNVDRIIVRETVRRSRLPAALQQSAPAATEDRPVGRDEVHLFTACYFNGDTWSTWQEAADTLIGEVETGIAEDDLPWQVLRFVKDSNEHYGRGLGDILAGDVRSLEGLEQAILEAAALMAQVVFMVDPGCLSNPDQLQRARTGSYLPGNADLVKAIKVDKYPDMTVPANLAATKSADLRAAFLMRSAVRRDGERVTAEEIRQIALELEEAFGGIFSLLAKEFQRPVIRKFERILERVGDLAKLPKGMVHTQVTAGIDALGRGRDALALRNFIADGKEVYEQQLTQFVDATEYLHRSALAHGIDPAGLVRTQEQAEGVRNRDQIEQFAQGLGGPGLQSLAQILGGAQAQPQPQ